MESTSAAGTSVARGPALDTAPPCVMERAEELLELVVLRVLAFCLGGTAAFQVAALSIAMLIAPHLHYIPEVTR